MQDKNVKYTVLYIFFTFLACIFIVLAALFYNKSKNTITAVELEYTETSDVNYKVYLKKNNFFALPYLDKTYLENGKKPVVTQLIDYIDINYDYHMNFSDNVSGKYTYYIKGVVEVNEANSEINNYGTKEYILTEKKEVSLKNTNSYNIFAGTKINYEEYSEYMNDIRKEWGISINGNLKVYLIIENDIDYKDLTEPIIINTDSKFEIPLTKVSAEININTDNGNKSNKVIEKFMNDESLYNKDIVLMIVCCALCVTFIILLIFTIKRKRKLNEYNIKLNKILSTYDSIIVNVDSVPDVKKFNVIKVQSFEELIDAHSEVRMPINYYKKKNKDIFILINGDMLWLLVLRKK